MESMASVRGTRWSQIFFVQNELGESVDMSFDVDMEIRIPHVVG